MYRQKSNASGIMKKVTHGFDWDDGNREKCSKHGLSVESIENFFLGKIQIVGDPRHSYREQRYIAVGLAANSKPMFVGFTYREKEEKLLIRPISARYMHEKEAKKYRQASAKIEE